MRRQLVHWALSQNGWRALLLRTAVLTALWLVVGFVFAMEFYLAGLSGGGKLPWTWAAKAAFRDWFPWVLLSPVVVFLAGRFPFDRTTWKRNVLVHLAACIFSALAYEALVIFASPLNWLGGGGVMLNAGPFSIGSPGMALPAKSFTLGTNDIRGFRTGPRPDPFMSETGVVSMGFVSAVNPPGAPPPFHTVTGANGAIAVFGTNPAPGFGVTSRVQPLTFELMGPVVMNRWTPLLHLAAARTQFTIPVYWCVVCICWVINHFQETRERERRALELEARLTQANLRALKMQLQPHFLFNTLNAISSLIQENPRAADNMVGSLSQFLRATLDASSENEVPLRQEIAFVDRYLEIQQARFGDRLRVLRELDAAVDDALLPPLILQPLVENAIRHGIEARAQGGTLVLRAFKAHDILHVEVADDGAGFRSGHLLKISTGIGLTNTKARLQELYGDQHQFILTANRPTGACVRIEIPFRAAPRAPQPIT